MQIVNLLRKLAGKYGNSVFNLISRPYTNFSKICSSYSFHRAGQIFKSYLYFTIL